MSCKRKISQVQKTSRQRRDVFLSIARLPAVFTWIHREFPVHPRKSSGFSIFRVVCKRSTGIILKGACAKADSEMHDKKIHRKYGV